MLTLKYIGENTEILLNDGRIKKVQDLIIGDSLLSTNKESLNIVIENKKQKDDNVYRIVQTYGNYFTIHEQQLLCVMSSKGGVYKLNPSKATYRHDKELSLLHSSVPHGETVENIDLYFLGLFLGHEGNSINCNAIKVKFDQSYLQKLKEIVEKFQLIGKIENDYIIIIDKNREIINEFLNYDLHIEKRIPHPFKTLNLFNKFYLLAGIMDSADTIYNQTNSSWEIYNITPKLYPNLMYLVRSMGYYCYSRYNEGFYSIFIYGKYLYQIPVTKKYNINYSGDVVNAFTAVKINNKNYYELSITNEYILLSDFTLL
jgi:hypothetical protein